MNDRMVFKARGVELEIGKRSGIVGILNVTPDSFSDGGLHLDRVTALNRAEKMLGEGASIIDIGGESTRPGFAPVSVDEEIRRVAPVIQELVNRNEHCMVSIDTSKTEVARVALEAGAKIVNDIFGFREDEGLADLAAEYGAGVILMRNGRGNEGDGSILERIKSSWNVSLDIADRAGVSCDSIVLDPGIGFGTTRQEDLDILRGLRDLRSFGYPLMLGASRKRITAQPMGLPLEQRLEPSLSATVVGIEAGVELFRVHDVASHVRAAEFADLIYKEGCLNE